VVNLKIIKQIFVILLFYIIGEILAYLIGAILPGVYVPGTIIGLVLLILVIISGKITLDHVDEVGTFLTNNMAFFFIPAAVSVIEYLDLLESNIFKILVIIVLTTIISFLAIYGSVLLTLKLMKREEA
jgi:holin-like protein